MLPGEQQRKQQPMVARRLEPSLEGHTQNTHVIFKIPLAAFHITGAVGPPVIGGIIGTVVGEKVGEKAAGKYGLAETAGNVSDDLAKVVGKRNVDKMGEITLTALGYSSEEECVCCPCMPASQILFFIMVT